MRVASHYSQGEKPQTRHRTQPSAWERFAPHSGHVVEGVRSAATTEYSCSTDVLRMSPGTHGSNKVGGDLSLGAGGVAESIHPVRRFFRGAALRRSWNSRRNSSPCSGSTGTSAST